MVSRFASEEDDGDQRYQQQPRRRISKIEQMLHIKMALIHVLILFAFTWNSAQSASIGAYSYGPSCIKPYKQIGSQCLFFSQPEPLWDIDETWNGAYLSFYDAVALCRRHGGDLAARVKDFGDAMKYCSRARGTCAPSLLWRDNKCFQWSPIDGTEVEIPCRQWEITMRFICEMKSFDKDEK